MRELQLALGQLLVTITLIDILGWMTFGRFSKRYHLGWTVRKSIRITRSLIGNLFFGLGRKIKGSNKK